MAVLPVESTIFPIEVPVLIIGAGAGGLVAALAAKDAGLDPVVLERDAIARGSTALSSGMIPACQTQIQIQKGIIDSVAIMAGDIMRKSRDKADQMMVNAICAQSGPAIDWLISSHNIELSLVEGFLYPGHSKLRMHAPASRLGSDLMDSLSAACSRASIDVLANSPVSDLFADRSGHIRGVQITRGDGSTELIGCKTLVLACNGFGGNPQMVAKYIPDMQDALYSGHQGNRGDAILWGEALGAQTGDLGSFQGHGSLAHPHGILISWALMMEGGIQINSAGKRFSNEHAGYSEQARLVIGQNGAIAWNIIDGRLLKLAQDFEDFQQAQKLGAVHHAANLDELAKLTGAPTGNLEETFSNIDRLHITGEKDKFGREFSTKPPLQPPFHAIKVTGSLFHTQGGLVVDTLAKVIDKKGTALPNLFACGGAARGISGPEDWGYLSGNGLLSAVSLGHIAGRNASLLAKAS